MSTSSKLVEKSQTQQIRTLVESMGGDKLIYLVWVEKENKKIKNQEVPEKEEKEERQGEKQKN